MDWILRAEISGVAMLIKFAKTLRLHAQGILAWYDFLDPIPSKKSPEGCVDPPGVAIRVEAASTSFALLAGDAP